MKCRPASLHEGLGERVTEGCCKPANQVYTWLAYMLAMAGTMLPLQAWHLQLLPSPLPARLLQAPP